MFYEKEGIDRERAEEIVELCKRNAVEQGFDLNCCVPAGGTKDYIETLMKWQGSWLIQFNDKTGSTRFATWKEKKTSEKEKRRRGV